MRDFRLALAQIRPRLGDVDANLALHTQYVERAIAEKCDVVVFPEQSLTGYFLGDLVPHVALRRDDPVLKPLLELSRDIAIVFGFIEDSDDHRFLAAAAYLQGGKFVHVHHKVYLVTYGMFDEARDLAPGNRLQAFDTAHGRFGMLLCEDLWHLSAASVVAVDGADVLLGLSSSPGRGVSSGSHQLGSTEMWRMLNRVYAQLFVCYVAHCNRVGFEDGVNFWGGSEVVGPDGQPIAQAPEFDEALVIANVRDAELRRMRTRLPLRRDENLGVTLAALERIAAERVRDGPR